MFTYDGGGMSLGRTQSTPSIVSPVEDACVAPVAMYAGAEAGANTEVREETWRVKKRPQSYGTYTGSST